MFGLTGLSIGFVVANFGWIMRNAPPPEDGDDEAHGQDGTETSGD